MVSEGLLERRLEGNGARHSEYIYWLTLKEYSQTPADGVEMNPKKLPAGATSIPKSTSTSEEKPEVDQREVEPGLRRQIAALGDQITALNLKHDREAAAHHQTRCDLDAARGELEQCHLDRDQFKARCEMLQTQIDQYDERKRFDTWFSTRPAQGEASALKEKMWESWLERSKLVEVTV
nr:hypothetical protein HUO10_003276 [Paraburkholderia busanensis]